MAEFSPGGCSKKSEVQYTVGIMVPPVPPTDMTSSSVCRVKYELQVKTDKKIKIKFSKLEKSDHPSYFIYFRLPPMSVIAIIHRN